MVLTLITRTEMPSWASASAAIRARRNFMTPAQCKDRCVLTVALWQHRNLADRVGLVCRE